MTKTDDFQDEKDLEQERCSVILSMIERFSDACANDAGGNANLFRLMGALADNFCPGDKEVDIFMHAASTPINEGRINRMEFIRRIVAPMAYALTGPEVARGVATFIAEGMTDAVTGKEKLQLGHVLYDKAAVQALDHLCGMLPRARGGKHADDLSQALEALGRALDQSEGHKPELVETLRLCAAAHAPKSRHSSRTLDT